MTRREERAPGLSSIKKALLTIQKLQSKVDSLERARTEPIAVVGMACRFPGGADSPEAFWRLLADGREAIREVPAERFDLEELYDPDPDKPGKMYMRSGGFLDQVDGFDAAFFRISPREASQMDPQQRLFLEVSWEALENAGQPPDGLSGGKTGVFAGVIANDYSHLPGRLSERVDAHYYPGVNSSFVAGRVSYFLGLHGPSMALDTACSSSLTAVHLACQSLRLGECDAALAGGVTLILSPEISIFLCKAKVISPTGQCRAFDKAADGMVRGEGCGVVVLKRLRDALEAGDRILAVVRGSAINHDGPSGGLTVPNPEAQELLYRAALQNAGVEPRDISYVEAHGTGTRLGDPVELHGLARTFCEGRSKSDPLLIGSVKTNIGHTESAAGVAGFIKTVMILERGEVPPSLHFQEPNPEFSWDSSPVVVASERTVLPNKDGVHRAGVSSFGLSGMNAHVILEAFERSGTDVEKTRQSARAAGDAHLLTLSAKGPRALQEISAAYARFLKDASSSEQASLTDVCSGAYRRRTHFENRLAVSGRSLQEVAERLDAFSRDPDCPDVITGTAETGRKKLAFVFSGQGAQWWAMGRELSEREPFFREKLSAIDGLFREESGRSLLAELTAGEMESRIHDTEVAQPAVCAMQIGLAELLKHWGIEPHAVIGHSMGEVAAAHCAGVLTLRDAVRVIYHRGRLLERATGLGKMAAVGLSADTVEKLVEPYAGRVSIAAENGPSSVVLSGEAAALDAILASLTERGVFHRELRVKFASHCPQMEVYQAELEGALRGISVEPASVPIVSSVSGHFGTNGDYSPSYWAENIRQPVRFATALGALIQNGCNVFVEMGPHPILRESIEQCLENHTRSGLVLGSLNHKKGERESLLETLGALHVHGYPIDLGHLYPHRAHSVVLPNYRFQRRRYWLSAGTDAAEPSSPVEYESRYGEERPLLGARLASPLEERQFSSLVSSKSPTYVDGHTIAGEIVFPASAYLEMALAAARRERSAPSFLRSVVFQSPLLLGEAPRTMQTVLSPADNRGENRFRIFSRDNSAGAGAWTLHATGIIGDAEDAGEVTRHKLDIRGIQKRCEPRSAEDLYRNMERLGYQYRGCFRSIRELWVRDGEVLGQVELRDASASRTDEFSFMHPALLDACLQVVLAALTESGKSLFVPLSAERVRAFGQTPSSILTHGTLRAAGDQDLITADFELSDASGRVFAEIVGLRMKPAVWASPKSGKLRLDAWCYEVRWEPKEITEYSVSETASRNWLLFVDDGPHANALVRLLETKGQGVLLVRPGSTFRRVGERSWIVDPHDPEDFRALFHEFERENLPCTNILYLWALSGSALESVSLEVLEEEHATLCGGVVHILKAIDRSGWRDAPRLWLFTRGSQATGNGKRPLAVGHAGLWGLAKVIALENPELRCSCLDLDPIAHGDQSGLIVREVQSNDGEDQIAIRHGKRLVARLIRRRSRPSKAGIAESVEGLGPVAVRTTQYGSLQDLALRPMVRRRPGRGEIEIGVRATGLNFRDVLNALGMLEEFAGELGAQGASDMPFGFECAGTVVALGEDVENFDVDDEVIAAPALGSLSSFVVVKSDFVVPKPAGLSFVEAATIPIAFLTAHYALHELAELKPGERVLIHAAAGGVGLAAVQVAQRAGAEVFATASPRKWTLLESLGVQHITSSRSLDFTKDVMAATRDRGVDVVLNSLSGEFISKNLDVCAKGGRLVELGRIGILEASQVRERRPDVSYFPFVLTEIAKKNPASVAASLKELMGLIEDGQLRPLPHTDFSVEDSGGAFRYMAQAKHIGKVVITQRHASGATSSRKPFDSDGSYLITGGLGALGLRIADFLVARGAQHLILIGRSAPDEKARVTIRRLERSGAHVLVVMADVSAADDVARMLRFVQEKAPPLRGVVHAAAVLDDGVLLQQSLERFRRVAAPKVSGTWNLHRATRDIPLEFFVCFSSIASLIGSPGQGNYAAASAFMDALVHHRRALGLPASSINWGPWSESGLAANLKERDQARWITRGIESMPPDRALVVLEELLLEDATQVGVLSVDWGKFARESPGKAPSAFLSELVPAGERPADGGDDLVKRLSQVSIDEAHRLLTEHVRLQLGRVLGLPRSHEIKLRQRLFDLGLDSLMAVELKNRIASSLGRDLRATLVFDYPTVEALVNHLADEVRHLETSPAEERLQETDERAKLSAELDGLSNDEVAELLARELATTDERAEP